MFEQVEALDRNKHANLKLTTAADYSFAKDQFIVPLAYTELQRASKYYPIVFSADRAVPQALLSLKQGENAFVDENGQWLVPYVPAHIRRYPFILARADEEGNYAVCFDPDAPHLGYEQGEPLYGENGEATDLLNRATEFLRRYQREMLDTERLFGELENKEVLAAKQLSIGRGDEQQATIRGFRAVDTDKLGELDNDTLGDWVKRGIMGLVYAHLHSLDNVRELAG